MWDHLFEGGLVRVVPKCQKFLIFANATIDFLEVVSWNSPNFHWIPSPAPALRLSGDSLVWLPARSIHMNESNFIRTESDVSVMRRRIRFEMRPEDGRILKSVIQIRPESNRRSFSLKFERIQPFPNSRNLLLCSLDLFHGVFDIDGYRPAGEKPKFHRNSFLIENLRCFGDWRIREEMS